MEKETKSLGMNSIEDTSSEFFPTIPDIDFIFPKDPFPAYAKKVPRQTKWLVERLFKPVDREASKFGEVPQKKPSLPAYYYSAAQKAGMKGKKEGVDS